MCSRGGKRGERPSALNIQVFDALLIVHTTGIFVGWIVNGYKYLQMTLLAPLRLPFPHQKNRGTGLILHFQKHEVLGSFELLGNILNPESLYCMCIPQPCQLSYQCSSGILEDGVSSHAMRL